MLFQEEFPGRRDGSWSCQLGKLSRGVGGVRGDAIRSRATAATPTRSQHAQAFALPRLPASPSRLLEILCITLLISTQHGNCFFIFTEGAVGPAALQTGSTRRSNATSSAIRWAQESSRSSSHGSAARAAARSPSLTFAVLILSELRSLLPYQRAELLHAHLARLGERERALWKIPKYAVAGGE